jgi:hypothetical protein
MHALMICLATATMGIDVGWQRLPEGGMEYIIQLDPQTLETLRAGQVIQSDIPPNAGEIRSYRIVVGAKKLPRETPPPVASPIPKLMEPKPIEPNEARLTAPYALPPNPGVKRLAEQPAHFMEPPSTAAAAKPQPKPTSETQSEQPQKPWLPLTFTLLGLFASLGANVFLGWIAWESRQRYRAKSVAAS